jgi:mRNA guanylyltransferase
MLEKEADMPAPFAIDAPGVKAPPGVSSDFRVEVKELLKRRSPGFPGAQPVSFARRHLEELMKQE